MRCTSSRSNISLKLDHAPAADPRRASTYLRVQFTAIVNPNSGQGQEALPDDGYTQAIQRLNSMNDARTIGYVATTWCTAKSGSVLDEVAVYARWGDFDPSLATAGIFFDETPTRYTPENVSYLQTICEAVHNHHGLRDGFVGKRCSFISALGVLRGYLIRLEAGGFWYQATPHYIACSCSTILWFRGR